MSKFDLSIIYYKIFGLVEVGTVALLVFITICLDAALVPFFLAGIAVVIAGLFIKKARHSSADKRFEKKVTKSVATAAGVIRAAPSAVQPRNSPQNNVTSISPYANVSAFRRRVCVSGMRIVDGTVKLFQITIQRDGGDVWMVWRSVDELMDMHLKLTDTLPTFNIPAMPVYRATSSVSPESIGDIPSPGSTNNSGIDEISLKRYQSLVSAWLIILNETPTVRDREELAEILDDTHHGYSSVPLTMLPHHSNSVTDNQLQVGNSNIASIRRPVDEGRDVPSKGRAISKLKNAARSIFNHGGSHAAAADRSTSFEVVTVSSQAPTNSLSASVVEPSRLEDTYESWLREKQIELGFEGDCFDNFRFTDISDEAKALFVDSGKNNGFQLRGQSYIHDKKKIPAGPAICKLICSENFEVDTTDGSDRHDHISIRGVVKRRIDAVLCLRDPPFLFILNFQIPGDPPISIVSIYALPPHLSRNLGVVSSVPTRFQVPSPSYPPISSQESTCIRLLEEYCSFPRTEAERLSLWGIIEEDSPEDLETVSQSQVVTAIDLPDADTDDLMSQRSSSTAGNSNTTGLRSASTTGQTDGLDSENRDSRAGSKRYLKALAKEALGRQRESDRKSREASEINGVVSGVAGDIEKPRQKKTLMQRMGWSRQTALATNNGTRDSSSAEFDVMSTSDGHNDVGEQSGQDYLNFEATTSVPPISPPRAPAVVVVPVPPKRSASEVSKPASGGWAMPSDITWPEPHEKGVYPPDDFKNKRFKLIPRIVDGPWVVKAAVRSQPALLGQKVVQHYFRGNGYVETDVYVGSSIIASQIVGICRGYAKHFVCEIGIVLQGEIDEELPERLLACITLVHPDTDVRRFLE